MSFLIDDSMQSVVVTGVSTGIGWATTEALTAAGYHVYGSVRKQKDIARLNDAFGSSFTPLVFDVVDTQAIKAAAEQATPPSQRSSEHP